MPDQNAVFKAYDVRGRFPEELDEPLAEIDGTGIELIREVVEGLDNTTILITSPVDFPAGFVERTIQLTTPPTISAAG